MSMPSIALPFRLFCEARGQVRPHDLLWCAPSPVDASGGDLPDWVEPEWPVVVRRDQVSWQHSEVWERIPVGLRGHLRHQRHPAWIDAQDVMYAVSPEMLAEAWPDLVGAFPFHPVLQALQELVPYLDEVGCVWGPTGSTGFTLATGCVRVRPESDLDLLLRAPRPFTSEQTERLKGLAERVACRLDIQVDTGWGGFALNEWLSGHDKRVLLKTASGPILTENPWALSGSEHADMAAES